LEDNPSPYFNGAVLTIATIIKFVMALAAEAELAALIIATHKIVLNWQTLIDMGWLQPQSPTVISRLNMYRTKVLTYRTMVLLARLTKVRR
jgi:hypothetical protein